MSMSTPGPSLSPEASEVLVWIVDDYTELFGINAIVQRLRGETLSTSDEREAVLGVLRELLENDLVMVGDMVADTEGLSLWVGPWAEHLHRIEQSWPVDQPLKMGHNPWFSATEKGRGKAASR